MKNNFNLFSAVDFGLRILFATNFSSLVREKRGKINDRRKEKVVIRTLSVITLSSS